MGMSITAQSLPAGPWPLHRDSSRTSRPCPGPRSSPRTHATCVLESPKISFEIRVELCPTHKTCAACGCSVRRGCANCFGGELPVFMETDAAHVCQPLQCFTLGFRTWASSSHVCFCETVARAWMAQVLGCLAACLATWLPSVWIPGCLDAWMPGCLDAWMPGCLDACLAAFLPDCLAV